MSSLISTVGGLSLFGLSGFVIGPLIAALFISAWSLFTQQQLQRPPLAVEDRPLGPTTQILSSDGKPTLSEDRSAIVER